MSDSTDTTEPEAVRSNSQPMSAGIVTALVGFTSSFAVVLTGLAAVGADATEAASGLLVLCVTQALGMLWLSRRYRMPITLAWSTPGAALLAAPDPSRVGGRRRSEHSSSSESRSC